MKLSHIDESGKANMVDVGDKNVTIRTAVAGARITMKSQTMDLIMNNEIVKGDVLSTARIAGIMAGKNTSSLIPLCHTIPIDKIDISFTFEDDTHLSIEAFAKCCYKTGIEMEALTAVSVSALTVYDMCKAVDRSMCIENVRLLSKSGGRSGDYCYDGE